MMKNAIRYVALGALLLGLGCATALVNPAPVQANADMKVTEEAIKDAMRQESWAKVRETPGQILASKQVKERVASVLIKYDQDKVTVEYESSQNMKFDTNKDGERKIMPAYNQWVDALMNRIRTNLSFKQ